MQVKYISLTPGSSSGLLRKLMALIVTVATVVLALMFSAVFLVVIAIIGAIVWAYLWWKTRHVRKQMRDFPPCEMREDEAMSGGRVFEGEVIRAVDTQRVR